ncbi:MAG: restriction endonuclease subunit S [bacterium]|nr:restriction endonuclease subunit S [bacterium]
MKKASAEPSRNVPKLRFSNFSDEWSKETLSELCDKISDGIHSTPIYNENGEYYFVNGNNLVDGEIVINTNPKKVDKSEYEKHKIELTDNTVLMSINGTIGNLAYYNSEKIVLGKSAGYLILKQELPKHFYFNILQTHKVKKHFNLELTGSTIKNLSLKTIKETKLFLPTLPEQTKIANFLTAVDAKIANLNEEKSLLENYKKGAMQKIFSQELRFKIENEDGELVEPPEWETKTFADVAKFINGKAYKQVELLSSGKYKVLRVGNLFSNNEWYYSDLELDEDKYVENGDLMYAWSATFGPHFWKGAKTIYHYHIWKVIPNKSLNKLFLYYVFMDDIERIKSQSQGGTMFHITKGSIEGRKLKVPTLPEQTKIANFLTSIDEKINATSEAIEKAQEWKKGLLQQMFV